MWQNENENIEVTLPDDELEHHGVKGQKWGVRRFQNSDGSLTDAGRKHYLKGTSKKESSSKSKTSGASKGGKSKPKKTPLKKMSVEQLREAIAKKKASYDEKRTQKELRKELKGLFKGKKTVEEKPKEESTKKQKSKKLEDMTDAEIKAAIARKQLEQQYKQFNPDPVKPKKTNTNKSMDDMTDEELNAAIRRKQMEQQYSQLNPKHVSVGKKVVSRVASTAFDASMEAGKGLLRDWLTKKGREALGLKDKDSLEQLKNESLRLTYKNTIAKAKKEMADRKTDEEWDLPNLRRAQETAELRTKIYDGYKKVNDVSAKTGKNNKTIDVDTIEVIEDTKKKKKK